MLGPRLLSRPRPAPPQAYRSGLLHLAHSNLQLFSSPPGSLGPSRLSFLSQPLTASLAYRHLPSPNLVLSPLHEYRNFATQGRRDAVWLPDRNLQTGDSRSGSIRGLQVPDRKTLALPKSPVTLHSQTRGPPAVTTAASTLWSA